MKFLRYCVALSIVWLPMLESASISREWILYVGTYTRQVSKGIYAYRFDATTGGLTSIGLAAEASNPSFLAVHPKQRFLYAVGEDGKGIVSAFSLESGTGMLKALNTVSAKGSGPCHVTVNRTGKWLFVANYGSGSTAAFPIRADGTLGEASGLVEHTGSSVNPARQAGPHAHSVNISADSRFLIVTDLGLDKALIYRFDATQGTLTPGEPAFAQIAPGSGPRHLAFSPKGEFAYVLNEMTTTVTALAYDKIRGSLREIQTISALPPGFSGSNSGAEIAVHPRGRFLYSSNRGHDSITVYTIDAKSGMLRAVDWVSTQGKTPRNFAIDPTGNFLLAANQNSNTVVVFRIDQKTGALTATGNVVDVPSPVSLVFAEAR